MDWQLEAAPWAQQQSCGPLGPIPPALAGLGKLILNLAWAQIYLRQCLLGSSWWMENTVFDAQTVTSRVELWQWLTPRIGEMWSVGVDVLQQFQLLWLQPAETLSSRAHKIKPEFYHALCAWTLKFLINKALWPEFTKQKGLMQYDFAGSKLLQMNLCFPFSQSWLSATFKDFSLSMCNFLFLYIRKKLTVFLHY